MAIDPRLIYGPQVDTTDPDGYPFGKARNDIIKGDGTGTPLERRWVNDLFGFFQNLLARAGIAPSGTPDRVGASQYTDALSAILSSREHARELALQSLQNTTNGVFDQGQIEWNHAVGRGYYGTGFGVLHTVNLVEEASTGGGVNQDESGSLSIAYSPSGRTIMLNVGGGNVGADQIAYSENGISGWSSGNFFVSPDDPDSAVFTLDRFMVVLDGFVETSPTGATWTRRANLTGMTSSAALAVNPTSGIVCAIDGDRVAIVSSDGTTQIATTLVSGASIRGPQYDPIRDRFVAGGSQGGSLAFFAITSAGAVTQLPATFPPGDSFESCREFIVYKNLWVAVVRGTVAAHDRHGVIFSSDSGQTWRRLRGVGWSGFQSTSPNVSIRLVDNRIRFNWGTYDSGTEYFSCISAPLD